MAQQHELVLNISPQELVVASYIGDRRESLLRVNLAEDWQAWLLEFLFDQKAEAPSQSPLQSMAASTHPLLNEPIAQLFRQNDIELTFLTHNNSSIKCEEIYPNNLKNWDLERVKAPGFDDLNPPNITNIERVEIVEPRELSRSSTTNSSGYLGIGANRIANAYGARALFQGKNIIIIDIGTLITFDVLSLEGVLLKGVTAPNPNSSGYLDIKGDDVLDMLLGGMERIVKKMRQELQIPLSVVATGGILGEVGEVARPSNQLLKEGLKEFVDAINPELTLYGIHIALKEQLHEYTP
ncbi:MAG: type III pantothenate kinase [Verrucomicrobia bacterium]|nr:type III pantothenate kinase [Verrucomicrobiota bacterium]